MMTIFYHDPHPAKISPVVIVVKVSNMVTNIVEETTTVIIDRRGDPSAALSTKSGGIRVQ